VFKPSKIEAPWKQLWPGSRSWPGHHLPNLSASLERRIHRVARHDANAREERVLIARTAPLRRTASGECWSRSTFQAPAHTITPKDAAIPFSITF
jgi:hypothetical protein